MARSVILITDGDKYAMEAVERVAHDLQCSWISQSAGNPTPVSGPELVQLIKQAPRDPVLVMFDDCGFNGAGTGEKAMIHVARHPDIRPLGAIAAASNTCFHEWTRVDVSIDQFGQVTPYGVDKSGVPDLEIGRLVGDTVYSLDQLQLPIVVGIGDIGKIYGYDEAEKGSPITKAAVKLILERSGYDQYEGKGKDEGANQEEDQ